VGRRGKVADRARLRRRARDAVGRLPQIFEALSSGASVDAAAIVRATRVFARRQRTWLRDQRVEWLAADAAKLP
jgi:tRNA A37 N6-isopentenylltransferase MiaA